MTKSFTRAQLVEWFDLDHITPSAAQFNTEKLNWLNAHYIKQTDNAADWPPMCRAGWRSRERGPGSRPVSLKRSSRFTRTALRR